jgi:K+-sensing histidine kinase KdpD
MLREPSHFMRYGVALVALGAAFALRYVLYGGLDNRLPFAFFVPATIIAAWYGGFGPGMLAAVGGLLLGDYFFLPPHHSLGPIGEPERLAIGLYAMNVTLIVAALGHLHARLREFGDSADAAGGAAGEAPRR